MSHLINRKIEAIVQRSRLFFGLYLVSATYLILSCTPTAARPTDTVTVQPRNVSQPTYPPNEFTEVPIPAEFGSIILMVSKNAYEIGEIVEFAVSNHSDTDIYYTYGCSWPDIRKIEDGDRMGVTVSILDEEPPLFSLAPGESHECVWDQMAYQDPNRESPARFQHYIEQLQVPSGVYQFRLDYFLNPEEIYSPEKAVTLWSETISLD